MKKLIGYEIKLLNNMIERVIINKHKENDFCITPIQIEIMKCIYNHIDGSIYQKDIERHTKLRRSTVSGILNTMEKNGFIIRISTTKDGRLKEVKLTEQAIFRISEIKSKINIFEKTIQEGINQSDLNTFYKVIDQIKENINKENIK